MSTVPLSALTLPELKRHLSDHVSLSEDALERTLLCWKFPTGDLSGALLRLEDYASVKSMLVHVTDGVMDLYARMPGERGDNVEDRYNVDGRDDEGNAAHFVADREEEANADGIVDAQGVAHREEANGASNVARKHAHIRPSVEEKGKGIKESAVEEDDTDDSDFCYAHGADDSNSSTDDDEVVSNRLQAMELRKKIKKKMLGEEEMKGCTVPADFIVPEVKEEEDANEEQLIESGDEVSYSEDSDGEVKTRKTKHRVYDENAEVQEFEVGQAFTDSRQFKQALINYGLKNFHHLFFQRMRGLESRPRAVSLDVHGTFMAQSVVCLNGCLLQDTKMSTLVYLGGTTS
ncbi:hypothetical protein ACQ4PT_014137 [Festuca glaucescens]